MDFSAAATLIASLLSEGPATGIPGMDDPEDLLTHFLEHAERSALTIREYETVLDIQEYCNQKEWPGKNDIVETCNRLLASAECARALDEAVRQGEGFRFAKRLGFDYSRQAYEQIESNPERNYHLIDTLLPDGLFVDEIITLFGQWLPLAEMATGPSDELGLGREYTRYHILNYLVQHLKNFPGKGEDLLLCALNAPVINCRNMALNVLDAWREKGAVLSQKIVDTLESLKSKEVNEDIRKRLENFNFTTAEDR